MSHRSGIVLIIGLLLIACLAQAVLADPDGTGGGGADQAVITPTPAPTDTPTDTPTVADTPTLTPTPDPTPVPTDTPTVADTPVPTDTPAVTDTPAPTETPAPTDTPVPTATATPTPTATTTPAVTATATPTPTPAPTVAPTVQPTVAITTPQPTPTPAGLQRDLAPENPAFYHYLDLKNLGRTSQIKQGYALGYVPPSVDLSHLKGKAVAWAAVDAEAEDAGTDLVTQDTSTTGYPASYDLRTLGKVTGVRDQGTCGACWAFATYGSLESTLLPRETWDFSENNMLNTKGYDIGRCDGGSDIIAMAYLARWSGPVNEQADPYSISAVLSPTGLKTRKHAQEMLIIPPRKDYTDNNNLKAAIMNYGGVYSGMYWDATGLNASMASYYAAFPDMPNHAITLVGWDDSFSRTRFVTFPTYYDGTPITNDDGTPYVSMPPGDGAFIAKNSWGTGFGDKGYFYLSYYDPMIGFTDNSVFTAEPLKNLRAEYEYDDLGWVGNLGSGNGGDTAWMGNVFRATEQAQVAAVSFYTSTENSEYTVSVYTDPTNGPISSSGPAATKSGTFELAGYHTVAIDPPVPVNLAQRFSAVVKIRTPNYPYPIPLEINIPGYTSSVVAHTGESFNSTDGVSWTDVTKIPLDLPGITLGNVGVNAFTVAAVPPPDARFTATPRVGYTPLKVTFRDRSLRKPTSWLWDFGDGTTSTDRNPTHTYATAGTFTVNLTVKNSGGLDFTTKETYITVGASKGKARPYYDFKKQDDDNTPSWR